MVEPSSFRDPSGHLFTREGVLYRQVNSCYRDHYEALLGSGLFETLVDRGLLVNHKEVDPLGVLDCHTTIDGVYKVVAPELVPFISYPYEWCFSALRDAALATLRIQMLALERGMSLKDSSAYNMQFRHGRPLLIDTLSFERRVEGVPWVAYRQFCQHFLAPLALMSYRDVSLSQLLRVNIDGLPLELASRLLPRSTRLRFGLLAHLHLHASSQRRYSDVADVRIPSSFTSGAFRGLIESLRRTVEGLKPPRCTTEWAEYYNDTNYSKEAMRSKEAIVGEFLEIAKPADVWDVGANIGVFSRLASRAGVMTVALDGDPSAVEQNYLRVKADGETNILPLVVDFTNPSGSLGWENRERKSLIDRGPADAVMALAMVHHFAISNNVPLTRIASFFARMCRRWLVVEFVPKEDSQVKRLLVTREDVFPNYSRGAFEDAFDAHFTVERCEPVRDSKRVLYLMRRRCV